MRRLACIYAGITIAATTAIVLILVESRFLVTLAQRSNVETLTLAVVLLLFGYLAILSFPGFIGAVKILWYNAPRWFGRDAFEVERRKQAVLKPARDLPAGVYLNCLIYRVPASTEPVVIPLQDEAGSLGVIRIDGARMVQEAGPARSANSVFAYFEQRIEALVRERDFRAEVGIVQWGAIDDEGALQYGSVVEFSRNLQKQLGSPPLWPAVELTDRDIEILSDEGRRLCPALRNEAHLPDVEYAAEHRLPIIPEPLAFIALSRTEPRADPVASMGCALVITVLILGLVVWFLFMPPWVPGK